MTFSDSKTYFFSPELSAGTEEDVIVMPNIPLFGAFRKLAGSGILEIMKREAFKSIFSGKEGMDKTPFLTLSVNEFLWGYPSILMTMDGDWGGESNVEKEEERTRRGEESESGDLVAVVFEKSEEEKEMEKKEKQRQWADFDSSFDDDFGDWNDGWGDEDANDDFVSRRRRRDTRVRQLNYKQFGFFHGRNGTSQGLRTVHTGLGNITRKGDVLSVGNEEGARGNWDEPRCNKMEGKDPGTISIGLTKEEDLLLYFPDMCRCE